MVSGKILLLVQATGPGSPPGLAQAPNQAFNALAIARWDVPPAAGRPLMQR